MPKRNANKAVCAMTASDTGRLKIYAMKYFQSPSVISGCPTDSFSGIMCSTCDLYNIQNGASMGIYFKIPNVAYLVNIIFSLLPGL